MEVFFQSQRHDIYIYPLFLSVYLDAMLLKNLEAVVRRCSSKCKFFKILQSSQESKYVAGPQVCNFIKNRFQDRCFNVKFAKFLRTPFLQNNSGGYFCNILIKGYLHYKTIFCCKVALDVQLLNFFIWRKNNVLFSRHLDFCAFVKSLGSIPGPFIILLK